MSVSAAIDLRHVRYFLAVSEELHFGRAARRLHVTQPPLSAAVRRLEDELGVQLLERTSRSVTLTDAGRVFADESRKTLAALQAAVEETRRAGGADATRRIGCVPALPIEAVLEYVDALRRRLPGVSLQIANENSLVQLEHLQTGELDLAIVFDPGDDAEVAKQPLFPGERLALFVPAGHPLGAKQVVEPGDVASETLVTGASATNPRLYRQLLDGYAETGFRFRDVVEVPGSTWPDLEIAVASGVGIALSPASLEPVGGVLRCTLRPVLRMPPAYLTWRAHAPGALRDFVDTAGDVARAVWAEHATDPR